MTDLKLSKGGDELHMWRVIDQRGMGFHSGWKTGEPFAHLDPDEVETATFVCVGTWKHPA